MTTLKEINFGLNQYCGPAVLSALTGKSTDECAAIISSVSGRAEIKAVAKEHLKEALKRLKFDVEETSFASSTLYMTLFRIHDYDGLYVVFVPRHVIAIEVLGNQIFICDNHCKTPLDTRQSSRLTQHVELVWRVFPHPIPTFIRSEIRVEKQEDLRRLDIIEDNYYENETDNIELMIGSIRYRDNEQLRVIIKALTEYLWQKDIR